MRRSDSVLLAFSLSALTGGVVSQDDGIFCNTSTFSDGGKKDLYFPERIELVMLTLYIVMYEGQCRDLYEDGLCALGERLWVREGEATAHCDCDEVEDTSLFRILVN